VTETLILQGVIVIVVAVGAVTDFRTGHIPNWLTFPALAVGPVAHGILWGLMQGLDHGFVPSLAGLLICGLVPYVFFRFMPVEDREGNETSAMGGGDVKLFAAMGAFLGPSLGMEAEFFALVVATLFAIPMLVRSGALLRTLRNSFFLVANIFLPKKYRRRLTREELSPMRLGPAILPGLLLALAHDYYPYFL
jgi:prepilin peptidase CpaA